MYNGSGAEDITHFNPRPPVRGATDLRAKHQALVAISIHAPRAGSDQRYRCKRQELLISIHAPRAGSDEATDEEQQKAVEISIHAPRAGSDAAISSREYRPCISIHAPRAGSDRENSDHYSDFQIILVWLFVSGRIWLLILNISQSI